MSPDSDKNTTTALKRLTPPVDAKVKATRKKLITAYIWLQPCLGQDYNLKIAIF